MKIQENFSFFFCMITFIKITKREIFPRTIFLHFVWKIFTFNFIKKEFLTFLLFFLLKYQWVVIMTVCVSITWNFWMPKRIKSIKKNLLTSCKAFLSIVLVLCKVLITFFAPSTTAASIRNRWRNSSMRSSNVVSSCSFDLSSPFSDVCKI